MSVQLGFVSLATSRIKRGDEGLFARMFDGLPYDHPVFWPWLVLSVLLLFVFCATIWALWGRRVEPVRRGFEVRQGGGVVGGCEDGACSVGRWDEK